ncbi:MAG: S9 family peptidase, partial [Acidimicrobiia bacterium]|nr:S9 family peptidase [Acidimicrobiia bacterium]
AFTSARHETRGLDSGSQIFEVAASGGEAVPVGDVGVWDSVSYSPDGVLHAVGHTGVFDWPGVVRLFRRDGDSWSDLTGHHDRSVTTFSPPLSPSTPQWTSDGAPMGYLVDSGRIRAVLFDGAQALTLVGGDRMVTGFSARPDGSALAFTASEITDPGELWWSEDGEERRLTSINEEFRSTVTLVEPDEVTIDTEDGPVHGWVYLPPGDEPVKVLFNIHGGPASQYGVGFFDEFQVYAGAGYGVVACNPQGSDGYGHDHVSAVGGEWQKANPVDLRDLQGFLAGVLDKYPRLDRDHVGVMGGSYGGLITVRLLAVDGSYTSAIAERGLYNWVSFGGASDIGPWFDRLYVDAQLPDGDDALWRASSLSHAGSVTTPTLIIHSDSDFRTPIDQGQQLYVLLRRLGVETELMWFPGEGHEMSRSGKPRHRIERFEAILDWHAKHC